MADYTPADVALVAEAVAATRTDCDPRLPCAACHASARAVLSALAGRLLPAGGRARVSWAVRDQRGSVRRWPQGEARQIAADCGGTLLFSICTTWPDGTALVGPWQPVAEGIDG